MILEETQMLSTVCREHGLDVGYRSTHKNHPVTRWCSESLTNWKWMKNHVAQLNKEFVYRFDKKQNHKSYDVAMNLPEPEIEDKGLTPFAQAMPEQYKHNDTVHAYRSYYIGEKSHLAKWSKRRTPVWFK